jgi:hypothetical protein
LVSFIRFGFWFVRETKHERAFTCAPGEREGEGRRKRRERGPECNTEGFLDLRRGSPPSPAGGREDA